jgi:hypothetical protein
MQDGFDANHAGGQHAVTDVAALVQGRVAGKLLGDDAPKAAADALELGARAGEREVQQAALVLRRGDAREGAHLRIGEPAPPKRLVDRGQLPQSTGHAHLLPRRHRVESDPPRQPVRAAQRALPMPLTRLVELPNARQQVVRGRVEMRGHSGDLFAESMGIVHNVTVY